MNFYVYDLDYYYIKLEDPIIEEDEDSDLKIKFKFNDELDKKVYIYLDNSEEKDYSFNKEIDKTVSLDFDGLYKEVKVVVKLDDNGKTIFERIIPVLVYNIDDIKFEFDDYETLSFETDEFELSNKNSKVEIKINLEDLTIEKKYENVGNVGDFDINIFENLNDEDKIKLLEDLLYDLSDGKIEVDYKIKIYFYNDSSLTNLIDYKEIKDDSYEIKDYDSYKLQTDDSFDIKLDVLEYNNTINSYSKIHVKTKTKVDFGSEDKVDVKTCVLFNNLKRCKTENFEEDELEEKVFDFYLDVGEVEEGEYNLIIYAKDDDDKNIIWKIKRVYVDNKDTVLIKIDTPYLLGKEGETKYIKIELRNLDNNDLNGKIILNYNGKTQIKEFNLKEKEQKTITIPVKLEESGEIIIRVDGVKTIMYNNKIDVNVIKKEINTQKENEKKEKNNEVDQKKLSNKEEVMNNNNIKCTVDKEIIYSKKDKTFLKIESEPNTKINVVSEFGNVLVNPKDFVLEDQNSKTIMIEKAGEEEVSDIIKITCEKGNMKKEIEVPIVIETINWKNYVIYGIIGVSVLLVFLIIIYLLI
jgi:hypothetical protein